MGVVVVARTQEIPEHVYPGPMRLKQYAEGLATPPQPPTAGAVVTQVVPLQVYPGPIMVVQYASGESTPPHPPT